MIPTAFFIYTNMRYSFFLLLVFFLPNCQSNTSEDTASLFEEYFQAFPNLIQPLDPTLAAQSIKEQAFKLYNANQHDQARVLFEELRVRIQDPEVDFYHGISLLALGQPENALALFRGIQTSVQFYDHAQWYSALAYIQKGEAEKAKEILQNIIQRPGMIYNQSKAKDLLDRL